ncbi:Uncharacterised protein [Legionella londiniensis]|uniref:Uncharacterized protein n=1 Tax=Legionella londiniensis TaxID=45068 RepID=A0A0W0VSZ8_9GAMM|nr:hypothetical protein Llon_0079 [Legionella londiniensis]STX93795.1 Uncharacterised protein [Legionella londiniensis]
MEINQKQLTSPAAIQSKRISIGLLWSDTIKANIYKKIQSIYLNSIPARARISFAFSAMI